MADDVGDLVARVAEGVARTRWHDDGLARTGGPPLAAGEEARAACHDLEALLHRGMNMRRHAAARLDPHVDVQHLAAVLLDRPPKAEPLSQKRILDHALLRVARVRY